MNTNTRCRSAVPLVFKSTPNASQPDTKESIVKSDLSLEPQIISKETGKLAAFPTVTGATLF